MIQNKKCDPSLLELPRRRDLKSRREVAARKQTQYLTAMIRENVYEKTDAKVRQTEK